MEQTTYIYRALIYDKRMNNYTVARTFREKRFNNRNELMRDFNNWVIDLTHRLKDEVIINEQIIE